MTGGRKMRAKRVSDERGVRQKGGKGWKDRRSRPAVVWEDSQIASLSFRRTRRERRSVCTHVNSAIGPDVRGDVRARWRGLSLGGPAAFENGIARRGCSRIARTLRKDGRVAIHTHHVCVCTLDLLKNQDRIVRTVIGRGAECYPSIEGDHRSSSLLMASHSSTVPLLITIISSFDLFYAFESSLCEGAS